MTYPILNTTATLDSHPQFHNAYVDVKAHFGAVGDGVTNDTAAIQAAIAAAGTDGTVFFPPGLDYLVSLDEIVFAGPGVMGIGATLKVTETGPGVAAQIGDGTGYFSYNTYFLPRINYAGTGYGSSWQSGSVGLKVIGAYVNTIHIQQIAGFEKGLYMTAAASGGANTAYNSVYITDLLSNKVNIYIDSGPTGLGWCNENNYFGGRLAVGADYGTNNPNCYQIYIDNSGGTSAPDSHRFYGQSIEGNAHAVDENINTDGTYCVFDQLRWEGSNKGIIFNSGAIENIVRTPYDITWTDNSGGMNRLVSPSSSNAKTNAKAHIDYSTGKLEFGSGTGAVDTSLYRYSADILTTTEALYPQSKHIYTDAGFGVVNFASGANGELLVGGASYGAYVDRNIADTSPVFSVRNLNASGVTGPVVQLRNTAGFVGLYVGSGTPEAVVTAATGSLYVSVAGGASTTLYVKESGSGNTGWVAK